MGNKYIFATHMGIGNRGCEALTKSLCLLLDLPREKTQIYSEHYKEDRKSDLQRYGKIMKTDRWSKCFFLKKIFYKMQAAIKGDIQAIELMKYDLSDINSESIVFITGGDLYCYEGTIKLMRFIHDYSIKQSAKTLLIGCSIDEKFLMPKVIEDLKRYDLITVRESMTYDNLIKLGIRKNVYLIPDSAFTLSSQAAGVLMQSNDNIVGINISKFINGGEKDDTLFFRNIEKVINYILDNTKYDVMLIPHVFWKDQDDRRLIRILKRKFPTKRVFIFNSEKLNYCQIRYVISQCRFFMGARTHSVISAYSECVPAIALGYSVKSIGIAKDLGMSIQTVIDCRNLKHEDELLKAFLYLENNEVEIKNILKEKLPSYIEQAHSLKKIIEKNK
ncbi:MAG: polysaccharide pyruvyl transferase family protein [Lachnospiraceae bacterium]|nr:polysaccharide pyruvyl transferase family protein [Lachnospiraceae bacterium]